MQDRSRISEWKLIVAALYAVAMLTLGFAHSNAGARSAAFEASSAQMMAAALPDGTLPSLCGKGPAGPAHKGGTICDACQLTSAPGAVAAPPAALNPPRLVARLTPVRVIASVADPAAFEPQSRGPPSFS
jgi:hypothetical protein